MMLDKLRNLGVLPMDKGCNMRTGFGINSKCTRERTTAHAPSPRNTFAKSGISFKPVASKIHRNTYDMAHCKLITYSCCGTIVITIFAGPLDPDVNN